MLSYRKFKAGTKSEVDELLKLEKAENPKRIVYCFGIYHEHPGTFILTYIRSTTPHHEYIGLYPKGLKFCKRMFEDIDRLVAYFQRHIDDPQVDAAPSIRSVAAMVPMRSPAPGSSAGGGWGSASNNGGWGGGQSFDRERSSTPASRGGRFDNRNGGSRDGLPPRYDGGGRGRGRGRGGRGRGGDTNDSGYGTPKWDNNDSNSGDGGGGGWSSFPGAKVQDSPGREAFPGGWGSSGSGGGGWDGGGGSSNAGRGGWGSSPAVNNDNGGGSSTGGWGSTAKNNQAQAGAGSGW